jgi:acyl-CoA dehydrogenase
MDFYLTEEQKHLKALVRQFFKQEIDPNRFQEMEAKAVEARTREELKASFPYDIYDKLYKVGLRHIFIPAKFGGSAPESDINQTMTALFEEAGYWGGGGFLMIPIGAFTSSSRTYITDEQREWIFSRLLSNPRFMISQTISEPAGATDIHLPYDEGGKSILQVNAYKKGHEWVINGDKMYSGGAGVADYIMVVARTDKDAPVSQAMSYIWVPADAPGVTIHLNRMVASGFGGNCQTHFDNVRVPEEYLIGQVNKGYLVLEGFFETMFTAAAGELGGMQRLYEQIWDYASQRVGGGKPLIKHSSIAAKLGEIAIDLEALRNYVYRAAWETDQAEKNTPSGERKVNLFWSQSAYAFYKRLSWRLCEVATDVYGGMSGSMEFPLEGFMRHAFVSRAAGLTLNVELMRSCWDFENRYRSI